MVSTKSTPLDRKMDTKTDTTASLRIWPPNLLFGVHIGVHSSTKTGSATLYHRLARIDLNASCTCAWGPIVHVTASAQPSRMNRTPDSAPLLESIVFERA